MAAKSRTVSQRTHEANRRKLDAAQTRVAQLEMEKQAASDAHGAARGLAAELERRLAHAVSLLRAAADHFTVRQAVRTAEHYSAEADRLDPGRGQAMAPREPRR